MGFFKDVFSVLLGSYYPESVVNASNNYELRKQSNQMANPRVNPRVNQQHYHDDYYDEEWEVIETYYEEFVYYPEDRE